MREATLVIKNATGLHARPAAELVKLCKQFASKVTIFAEGEEINAKSIASVLAGGVMEGTEIKLQVEGADEQEAGEAIISFLNNLTD